MNIWKTVYHIKYGNIDYKARTELQIKQAYRYLKEKSGSQERLNALHEFMEELGICL